MVKRLMGVGAVVGLMVVSAGCEVRERGYVARPRREVVVVEERPVPRPVYVESPPPRIYVQEPPPRVPIIIQEAPRQEEQVVVIRNAPPAAYVEARSRPAWAGFHMVAGVLGFASNGSGYVGVGVGVGSMGKATASGCGVGAASLGGAWAGVSFFGGVLAVRGGGYWRLHMWHASAANCAAEACSWGLLCLSAHSVCGDATWQARSGTP